MRRTIVILAALGALFYLGAAVVLIVLPWLAGRTLQERAAHLATAMSRADLLEEEKRGK